MKEGWKYVRFEDCLVKVQKQKQIKSKDYLSNGCYPIVSQESNLISGYCNDESFLYHHEKPVVVFGDHTKIIKYIDFDFVVGADGTHVLSTIEDINTKYFYYALKSLKLRDLGYARHYKLLKEKSIPVPPLSEQQRIVSRLDASFAKIDTLTKQAEESVEHAKALFQAKLKELMEKKEGWEEKKLGELVRSNIVGMTRNKLEQAYNKSYPYFKMNNISNENKLCWNNVIFVDACEEELHKYILEEGDFLFNTRNSKEWVGKSTVYRDSPYETMLYNNNIMRIRFIDIVDSVFVSYIFLEDFVKNQLDKIKSGTTNVWAIYYRDLKNIQIPIPPLPEQHRIVQTLDSLSEKIQQLQQNYNQTLANCQALKQAILKETFE